MDEQKKVDYHARKLLDKSKQGDLRARKEYSKLVKNEQQHIYEHYKQKTLKDGYY